MMPLLSSSFGFWVVSITAGGTAAPPLADDVFDVNGTVKACSVDSDCTFGESPPTPQTVCRDSTGDGVPNACYIQRQRYLAFKPNPNNGSALRAIRVSLDTSGGTCDSSIPLGFASVEGNEILDAATPGPQVYHVTRLEPVPDFRDWSSPLWFPSGFIMIRGCAISPNHVYCLQAINDGEDVEVESNYSAPLVLATASAYGDVSGGGNPGDPPNNTATLVDVFAVIQGFQLTNVVPTDWLDQYPGSNCTLDTDFTPDLVIDMADAFTSAEAFCQNPYGGPSPLECLSGTFEARPSNSPACAAHADALEVAPHKAPSVSAFWEPGEQEQLLSLTPTRASGIEGVDWFQGPGQREITLAHGNQDVEVEVTLENFGPVVIKYFQVSLDCASLDSTAGSSASAVGIDCTIGEGTFGKDFCLGINEQDPRYLLEGTTLPACRTIASCPDGEPNRHACGAVAIIGGQGVDKGEPRYVSTFAFFLPSDATGNFVLDLDEEETFFSDHNGCRLENLTILPAHVFVLDALAPPLADDRFDVNGTIKPCQNDQQCKFGETGPDPQTVCRDSTGDGEINSCYVSRQRYLSVKPNPNNAGFQYAYRISLDTGLAGSAELGFAGEPQDKFIGGPGPNDFHLARIVDTPHYMDWTTLQQGYVSIGDCEVSPYNTYLVQAIAQGADTHDETNYSFPISLPTPQIGPGDVTGGGNPGDPPNGATGSLVDVFSIIRGFQLTQNEPGDWLDIHPQTGSGEPNMILNLADAFDAIQFFQQNPYPGLAPLDCP